MKEKMKIMRKAVYLSGAVAAVSILFSGGCYAGEGGSEVGASFLNCGASSAGSEVSFLSNEVSSLSCGAISAGSGVFSLNKEASLLSSSAASLENDGTASEINVENGQPEYDPQIEEVSVTIPGMEGECTLLWISDMHICSGADDPDVTAEHADEAQERYDLLRNEEGTASGDTWKLLSSKIDSYGADHVIFGADMVDYASEQNLSALEAGLENVRTPWMYIRADHDYGRWYSDMKIKRMRKLHRQIAPQNKIWVERFDDFTLAGLDNTTTAISEETLDEFRKVYEEGRPIILCTHVPFDTGSEDSQKLAGLSEEKWGDRVLCWGDGDEYDTSSGQTMSELLEMITAKDSPVCAVLAGHLHLTWEGNLTDSCIGHVFSAAYEDHIGVITVSG